MRHGEDKMNKKRLVVLTLSIFLTGLFSGFNSNPGFGEESDNTDRSQAAQMKKQQKEFEAHRQYVTLHFDDNEMDFSFEWVLGSTTQGGCEIGEAFYTASQIKNGDAKSWQQEWRKMAERSLKRARKCLREGNKESAREAFMRASNYYRASVVSMLPWNPDFKIQGQACRDCMKEAAKLFNPPVEYIEIPFEETVLPGYFWKGNKSGKKAKTLVMIGGGETFIEDNFFYIALEAHKRGYNFVTVDLPGQGMLPLEGQIFRPDVEVPMKEIMNYVLERPEVDPKTIGMYGISGGGYFVPRSAIYDKRIKAIAVSSAVVEQEKVFANMPIAKATKEVVESWPSFKRGVVQAIAWRWGVAPDNIMGLVPVNKDFNYDPKGVTCPAMILIGEGEYSNKSIQKEQKLFYDNISTDKKKFVLTPANEGASSHCIGENRSLMAQEVFDWFDSLFQAAGPAQ